MASARRAAGWLIAGLGALAMRAPFVAAGDAEVLELAVRERLISTARTVEATSTPAPTQTEVQTQGQQPARLAPLPAKPLFQQPVTRTRRS